MHRIVLDTNVLVSGLLSPVPPPGRIVDLLNQGTLIPLFDTRVLAEYEAVLSRPRFHFPASVVRALLDNIELGGVVVSASLLPGILLPDISDLPFLEVAAAGSADYLITGNGVHFAPIKGEHAVEVISPRRYIEVVAGGESPRIREQRLNEMYTAGLKDLTDADRSDRELWLAAYTGRQ